MLLSALFELSIFARAFALPLIVIVGFGIYVSKTAKPEPSGPAETVPLADLFAPRARDHEEPLLAIVPLDVAPLPPTANPSADEPNPAPAVTRLPTKQSTQEPVQTRTANAPALQSVAAIHLATGLSWEQFALVVGVSRSTARSWVTGGNPSPTNRRRLQRVWKACADLAGGPEGRQAGWEAEVDGITLFERVRTQNLDEVSTRY